MNQKEIINWMSKNPKSVMEDLEKVIKESERIYNGLEKVRESVLTNESERNLRKQLHVTMKSLSTVTGMVRKLALMNMVLVSGKTFSEKPDFLKDNPAMKNMFGNIFG